MRRTTTAWLAATGMLIAWGAIVFTSYHNEMRAARARTASGGRIANTAVGRTEYTERGAGMPLLSIHGAGGGYDQGLANAIDLVGDGYRIIAPSRFGYLGAPVPSDTSSAAQADAIAALLRTLKVRKAIVVGISAGARSAMALALRHPDDVAALVLIVPGTYAPANPVSIKEGRGNRFVFWLVNAGADFVWWTAERIAPSMLIRFVGVRPELVAASPPAEKQRVMQIVESIEPLSRRSLGINIDSHPDTRRPPLERIAAPTLVISARDDLFNTLPAAEFAARTIPNAKLVVYETGGHLLLGHAKEVRGVVRDFLTRAGIVSPSSAADLH